MCCEICGCSDYKCGCDRPKYILESDLRKLVEEMNKCWSNEYDELRLEHQTFPDATDYWKNWIINNLLNGEKT